MPASPKRVFVSYARSTNASTARALRDALGSETVFLDEQDIGALERFPTTLTEALLASHVVVVLADPTYFERWYCLREWMLARAPWLAARRTDDDALRRRSVEHLIVALPRSLSEDDKDRLPLETQHLNLRAADNVELLAEAVRERLARLDTTLDKRFETFGVPADVRSLLTDKLVVPRAPQRLGTNGNTARVRPSLGDAFVGRADELWSLHDLLSTLRGGTRTAAVTGALQGGGGFGKTRLAIEYAHRYGPSNYPGGLFWVDASEPSLLSSELRDVIAALADRALADTLPESELRLKLHRLLVQRVADRGDALFVVDNLPETAAGQEPQPLEHYCPALGEVTCLVTSRVVQGHGRKLAKLTVPVLDREAAVRLLTRGAQREALNQEEWEAVADWVGRLPLALEILGGVLTQAGVPPSELLELARQPVEAASALDAHVDALRGLVPAADLRGIADAFRLSLERLDTPERELALDLAWLSPAPIPQAVLRARTSPDTLLRARVQLVRRSFLAPSESDETTSGALQMHRVMASYLRGRSPGAHRATTMWKTLHTSFDGTEIEAGRENRALLAALVPHVAWLFEREELHSTLEARSCLELSERLRTSGERHPTAAGLECSATLARRFVTAQEDDKRGWALVALGDALQSLGERQGDPACLAEAVNAYGRALEVHTRDQLPFKWAMTQNNLGNALTSLGERQGDPVRLAEAVEAYGRALEVHTRDHLPLQWAMTQNNLGAALARLGERGGDSARLTEAGDAFRRALEVRTRDQLPFDWAMTQNNLGNTLARLAERQGDVARLAEAVDAYGRALEVYTRDQLPLDWAMTQNNLGAALARLGEREGDTARIAEAVSAYSRALQVYTREQLPLDWAMTQDNLGTALTSLGEREGDTSRLVEACAAFRRALEIYTYDQLPLDWARTQNNLGIALVRLGEREGDTASLIEAVEAFHEALEVFDPHVPTYREIASRNLARTLDLLGKSSSSED